MTITVVFDPPLPSDSPATFNTKAFSTLGDLNDWSTEANTLQADVNSKQSTASTAATNAANSASAASTSATNAANSASAAAASAASITWTSPGAIGSTTPNSGAFTTLSATGNATLGDAEATDTHTVKGATTVLANSASPALKVTQTGAGNAFVVEDSASTDSTPFVIDANGRVVLGTATVITVGNGSGWQLNNHGTSTTGVVNARWSNDAAGPAAVFAKSKSSTVGVFSSVVANDTLGGIRFFGDDGSTFNSEAAQISAVVDGTPGTNHMPGRLVFSTTAYGGSPTERMRIDSSGNVLVVSAGGLGYGTGAGGTVTQATSRTTGVTLNKPTGAITLVSAAGSTSWQSFTVTNSLVAATDVVLVSQKSGTDKYMMHVTNVAAGSFQITFATTGGTTTEQPVFNVAVIKGATS